MKEVKNVKQQIRKAVKPRTDVDRLAHIIGVSRATFYRRLRSNDFTPAELKKLKKHHYLK